MKFSIRSETDMKFSIRSETDMKLFEIDMKIFYMKFGNFLIPSEIDFVVNLIDSFSF